MDDSRSSGKRNIIISLTIAGVLAIAVLGVLSMNKKSTVAGAVSSTNPASTSSSTNNTPSTSSQPATNSSASSSASSTKYKDGTYTASASYSFPDGSEVLTLNLTLANDIVTKSNVSVDVNDRQSQEYVSSFLGSYKSYVVGKDITSLRLSKVAGSSLTSLGFNDALDKIRQQAS